jgi:hypothetical protein
MFLAAAAVLAGPAGLRAQPPAPPAAPTPSPAPGFSVPESGPGGAGPSGGSTTPGPKTCVREERPRTKTVYGSVCKQYCLADCSLTALFHKCLGGDGDCGCECGPVRTRNVLVKKTRPDCSVSRCVIKDLPAPTCQPALVTPVIVLPPPMPGHAPVTSPPAGPPAPAVALPEVVPPPQLHALPVVTPPAEPTPAALPLTVEPAPAPVPLPLAPPPPLPTPRLP